MKYCCEEFRKIIEEPESVYNIDITFRQQNGKWWTDFSDCEFGDIELTYCPFCGEKLK